MADPIAASGALAHILATFPVDPRPGVLFDHVWAQARHGDDRDRMGDLAVLVLQRFGYRIFHDTNRLPGPDLRRLMRHAVVPEPGGCQTCGADRIDHGRRPHVRAGVHEWVAPSDAQRRNRIAALTHDLEVMFG